ncbi:MAG TPA: hypothetical protein PKC72_16985 [Chitinophagaceae bacterium]|nr:hypothetical protein [Chitinophagaceae bacterium]
MRINSAIAIVLAFSIFVSCRDKAADKTDYIITEKDLIPEGVAFDAQTQTIYIGSTHKRKIISISKEGKVTDFIKEAQDDIKSVIGMEVDSITRSLWAVSSEANEVLPLINPGNDQWKSSIFQFRLDNGKLRKKYRLNKDSVFLNDLTVASDGSVYITESIGKSIYKIIPGADTLQLFMKITSYQFINGISFSDIPDRIFATSTEGIISINLQSKEYSLLPAAAGCVAGSIDGLAFHKNYFIAHQSSRILRFYLSEKRDSIISCDTLDNGKEFDSSTTGEVSGNYYYYIVNSQIQSGVNYENQMIKPHDSLENIIIRKIKL